jgi:hypothetical protein
MPQAICGFCGQTINDKEYLAVTNPDELTPEERAGQLICPECAKKLYPDLYDTFYSKVDEPSHPK